MTPDFTQSLWKLPRTLAEFIEISQFDAPETQMTIMTTAGERIDLALSLQQDVRIMLWLPPCDALTAVADTMHLFTAPLFLAVEEPERTRLTAELESAVSARSPEAYIQVDYFVPAEVAWPAYRTTLRRIVAALAEQRRWPPGLPYPEEYQ